MSAVLYINRSESRCGACGGDANPAEQRHDSLLGYGTKLGARGCGAAWTHVSSDYCGPTQESACREMRPDLAWIDPMSTLDLA